MDLQCSGLEVTLALLVALSSSSLCSVNNPEFQGWSCPSPSLPCLEMLRVSKAVGQVSSAGGGWTAGATWIHEPPCPVVSMPDEVCPCLVNSMTGSVGSQLWVCGAFFVMLLPSFCKRLVSPCWKRKKLEKSFPCSCVAAVAVLSYLDKVQVSQVMCEQGAGGDDVPRLAGLNILINTPEPLQKEKSTASN